MNISKSMIFKRVVFFHSSLLQVEKDRWRIWGTDGFKHPNQSHENSCQLNWAITIYQLPKPWSVSVPFLFRATRISQTVICQFGGKCSLIGGELSLFCPFLRRAFATQDYEWSNRTLQGGAAPTSPPLLFQIEAFSWDLRVGVTGHPELNSKPAVAEIFDLQLNKLQI